MRGLFPTSHSKNHPDTRENRPDARVEDDYSGLDILGEPHFAVGASSADHYNAAFDYVLRLSPCTILVRALSLPEAGAADLGGARGAEAAPPHAPG